MSSKAGEGKGNSTDIEDNSDQPTPPKKTCFSVDDFTALTKDELSEKWKEIEKYILFLEDDKKDVSQDDPLSVRGEEKTKAAHPDSTPRENVLVMRLATKEQEIQELLAQINELKHSQNPATSQLRSTLLDPAVNLLFERMKTELTESKEKLEQAQNDLSAWKFTPDSVTGKKLMAKCRMLIQENQDLGKQLSQGRLAQLEAELALQKKYSEELKGSQDELNEFVIQLDEEVEGMQSTICVLQQQLKECRAELQRKTQEVTSLNDQLNISIDLRNLPEHATSRVDSSGGAKECRTSKEITENSTVDNRTNCADDTTNERKTDCLDRTDCDRQSEDMIETYARTISIIQHGIDAKSKTPSPQKIKTAVSLTENEPVKQSLNHKLRTRDSKDLDDSEAGNENVDGGVLTDCNGELVAVGDR